MRFYTKISDYMKPKFVARENEIEALEVAFERDASSFIAIYGRRRIGKTKTVIHFCEDNDFPIWNSLASTTKSRNHKLKVF